jgi:hypothetical protein
VRGAIAFGKLLPMAGFTFAAFARALAQPFVLDMRDRRLRRVRDDGVARQTA